MSLDEILKVIKTGTWICVRVINEAGAIDYYYPPKEVMHREWNEYRVLSVEGHSKGGIVIDVEEVD